MPMRTSRNLLPWTKLLRLRFGQLRLLTELDETGSIRRAAASLNMSQPAVSKALKELEAVLGVQLFDRTVQGVEPTSAGAAAARGARVLLSELELLANEVRQAGSSDSVSLRLGISPYLGASLLPGALTRLSNASQLGMIHLEENWAPVLLDRLAQGALDMLLIVCSPEMVTALDNPSLTHDLLCSEDLAVVAAPNHRFAARQTLSLADLVTEPWILGTEPSLVRQAFNDAFLHAGFRPPIPTISAAFAPTMMELAAAGLGIAGLPGRSVEIAVASGRLVKLRLRPVIALPPIVIVYRRLMIEHPRLAAIVAALRQEFSSSL